MIQFYISVIFIGIVLIIISFIWILYDRKKTFDYTKGVDDKKAELLSIMKDAEEMLDELNKLSGYIADEMEVKNSELKSVSDLVDEKIKEINSLTAEINEAKKYINENKVKENVREVIGIQAMQLKNFTEEINTEKNAKSKVKSISANGRCGEVIKLSQSGLGETEIAKKLSMGKGEIQLILGLGKKAL
ncbi:MAG: hypothetical protein Q8942_13320 [Bacillota bacterium]|nr:hypothetical protein [Bacillota bacterium]